MLRWWRAARRASSEVRRHRIRAGSGGKHMKCFVISPIGDDKSPVRQHADEVFKYLIEPALSQFGVDAVRSDRMTDAGRISDQMYRAIFEYDICIAVLTFANPNVYYELAVAQSAARPVIALIDKTTVLPFDLKDFRVIDYDLSISSYESKIHIDRLVAFLNSFKAADWRGEDVFAPYRSGASRLDAFDPRPYEVRISSPGPNERVTSLRVEGTFLRLPVGYELRTLRYYPEQHAFVPHGAVLIDQASRKWWVNKFDVGGKSNDERGIWAALAGADARILLDVWTEAHSVHRAAVKDYETSMGRPPTWLPSIKQWPSDLIVCDRILVTRA